MQLQEDNNYMGLLAQHAYGKSKKISVGLENKFLNGVILSPKAEKPEKLKEFIDELNSLDIAVYFDPQFYMCAFEGSISLGKLESYDFWRDNEITKKYLSVPQNVRGVVTRYVDYQTEVGLKNIVSPNVFFESFDSRMSQISLSLANESISMCGDKELYISLCINEAAFSNFNDECEFLDIISLFEVKGFYIIIERNTNENPNIIESEKMANIMYFLYNLAEINGFDVILGYSDYVGLPFYTSGIKHIATGWYENTRKFDRNNFYQKDGMRRPNKRYYSNKLLNSILLIPELQMIQEKNLLGSVLSQTQYDHYMYNDWAGSLWTDSYSCLSRWEAENQILKAIDQQRTIYKKIEFMKQKIYDAKYIYSFLPEDYFDVKSKSTHLDMWMVGLHEFEQKIEEI